MRGGRLLGQGSYGCVFSPGFQCSARGSSPKKLLTHKEKTVSKIQVYNKIAKNEIEIGKKLREIPNASSYFQVLQNTCPVSIEQLKDEELQMCELPSLNTSKLIMLTFPFIEGEHPIKWLRRKNQPLIHLEKLIKNICICLEKLADHSIVHNDLKNTNILVKSSNKPIILDFGMAIDMSSPIWYKSFFYAPEYEIISPETHFMNEKVTDKKIDEVIYYTLRPLSLFLEKDFLEKYRKSLKSSLNQLKELSNDEKRKRIKKNWDTWDVYSIAFSLIQFLVLLRAEGHVEENKQYFNLLEWGLQGINPLHRVNSKEWLALKK